MSKKSWIAALVMGGIVVVSTQAQAQRGNQPNTSNPDAQFVVVPVKHVYVGGIAQLFRGNVGTISTEQFVVPASAGQAGGRGGNRTGIMSVGGGGNNRGGYGSGRSGRGGRRR